MPPFSRLALLAALLAGAAIASTAPLACSGGDSGTSGGGGTSTSSTSSSSSSTAHGGGGAGTGGTAGAPTGGSGGALADAGPDQVAPATLGVISVPELVTELQAKDFLLIGVHTPYYKQIPGTDANIAWDDVPALTAYIGANLDQKVVVYCMTNSMSTAAGQALVDLGYRAVRYLDGGMNAWTAAGHTLDP